MLATKSIRTLLLAAATAISLAARAQTSNSGSSTQGTSGVNSQAGDTTGSSGRKPGASVQGTSGDHSTSLGNGSAMSPGAGSGAGGDTGSLSGSSSDQNKNKKMWRQHRRATRHAKPAMPQQDSSSASGTGGGK